MDINIPVVLSQNITLVYNSLDLRAIDSRKLKELIGDRANPMVMDTPDMIVAVYPPQPIIIQIGDRRIRITFQQESKDIGSIPLWEIALKCHQLVPESSKLIAYGFNYDVRVEVKDGDARAITIELFVADRQMIEDILGGQLSFFAPRFKFKRSETLYDLILEPLDEKRIKALLNAHFAFKDISLPPQDKLEESYRQEFGYLVSILPKLLKGGR